MLKEFLNHVDWETLLNRRGTTWRKIPEEKKENLNKTNVLELMLEHPTIIKRPVLSHSDNISVGFTEDYYSEIFL